MSAGRLSFYLATRTQRHLNVWWSSRALCGVEVKMQYEGGRSRWIQSGDGDRRHALPICPRCSAIVRRFIWDAELGATYDAALIGDPALNDPSKVAALVLGR